MTRAPGPGSPSSGCRLAISIGRATQPSAPRLWRRTKRARTRCWALPRCARVDITGARTAFERAIALESGSPLARLGLGLAQDSRGAARRGAPRDRDRRRAQSGRRDHSQLPRQGLFRREARAAARLAVRAAKELDPLDPTPWFYDAIRKQTINRPVEALEDLQRSIDLNDNRAVYRSRLLLDQDLAARSASLGRIYRDLGFEQLAPVEGWKSVDADPGDYSGHRLLADIYSALPRHEVARVSELLQSQLLQPINITPVPVGAGGSRICSFSRAPDRLSRRSTSSTRCSTGTGWPCRAAGRLDRKVPSATRSRSRVCGTDCRSAPVSFITKPTA